MRVGVLSDTHGHVKRARQAVAVFDQQGVEAIFHCGDVGRLDVLEQLLGRPIWFVWGNMDRPDPAWRAALEVWNVPWPERSPLRIELADKQILLAHGHEVGFGDLRDDPGVDFCFYGHSHQRDYRRIGRCTAVNPGAVRRAWLATVGVVDLGSADVCFFDLQGRPVSAD